MGRSAPIRYVRRQPHIPIKSISAEIRQVRLDEVEPEPAGSAIAADVVDHDRVPNGSGWVLVAAGEEHELAGVHGLNGACVIRVLRIGTQTLLGVYLASEHRDLLLEP